MVVIKAVADMIEARVVVTEAVEVVTGTTTDSPATVAATTRLHQAGSHLLLEQLVLELVFHRLLPRRTTGVVMAEEAILSLMQTAMGMARHLLRLVSTMVVVVVDIRDTRSLLHRAAMITVMGAEGEGMVVVVVEAMIVVVTTMVVVDIGVKKCSNGCPMIYRLWIMLRLIASSAHQLKSLGIEESQEKLHPKVKIQCPHWPSAFLTVFIFCAVRDVMPMFLNKSSTKGARSHT